MKKEEKSSEKTEEVFQYKNITYMEGKQYYVNNTYSNKQVESIKLETKEDFEEIFSPAAVMGEGGLPTPIDFDKSFVLAVIGTEVNQSTLFEVISLKDRGEFLELIYSYKVEGEKLSYSLHPFFFVIVDKKYSKDVRFLKE
ncbi:hypothetical protein [Myroides pelagicus]|nr:hypothetical protein [Myroides pelagicus]